MSSHLADAIAALASQDPAVREGSARKIYDAGCALAGRATQQWRQDQEFAGLLGPEPRVTVGVAVEPSTFERIREANGTPPLAHVPPDQDAQEFELHFPQRVSLDVLTTREPGGPGALARYLSKLGEGIQQVEYRCSNLDRATAILKEKFGLTPVYPESRLGAESTRINFFLVSVPDGSKVLIELYEVPSST
jgi:hypothetical protein